jgi:kynureninase
MISRDDCHRMDAADTVSRRLLFKLPPNTIYLDGGSLGAMPASVTPRMEKALDEEWAMGIIRSWNDAGWYYAPQRAGGKIAKLLGVEENEVIVADSTSVNLFKVLMAAMRMRPNRKIIVAERTSFPTNTYLAESVARLMGAKVRWVETSDIDHVINDDTAVVSLTHVNYRTSRRYQLGTVTRRAHGAGALMVWDVCHSVGVMPLELNRHAVDFAVGCGYKYLNGGPGAPSHVFVANRHLANLDQPLTGWHGHAKPFDFSETYTPHPGIEKMLVGTAPQLGVLALEEALKVYDGINLAAVRAKSVALSGLFIDLVDQELDNLGFAVGSPRTADERGSHISLVHVHAHPITQAMIARNIVNGFRTPDMLRFGLAPLYTRFIDIWETVGALKEIVLRGAWDTPEFKIRKTVS